MRWHHKHRLRDCEPLKTIYCQSVKTKEMIAVLQRVSTKDNNWRENTTHVRNQEGFGKIGS